MILLKVQNLSILCNYFSQGRQQVAASWFKDFFSALFTFQSFSLPAKIFATFQSCYEPILSILSLSSTFFNIIFCFLFVNTNCLNVLKSDSVGLSYNLTQFLSFLTKQIFFTEYANLTQKSCKNSKLELRQSF